MREYKDEMSSSYNMHYNDFDGGFEESFKTKLEQTILDLKPNKIFVYEVEDKDIESMLLSSIDRQTTEFEILIW